MKRFSTLFAVVAIAGCASVTRSPAPGPADLATARAEITPQLAEMLAAANAHDTDRHLAYYVRSPDLLFVVNDETIRGFDSLRVRQLGWWLNGKSDVVYGLVADPIYAMPVPGTVVQTYALSSRRSGPDGAARAGRINVTAIWQKRPDGWRIVYAQEAAGAASAR